MAKSHRDNHAARKKRGPVAFAKKAARRERAKKREQATCRACGNWIRRGLCTMCGRPH